MTEWIAAFSMLAFGPVIAHAGAAIMANRLGLL